jgi:cellulose synthase (UDP-forming)
MGTPLYMLIIFFWLVINAKDLLFAILFMFGRKKFRNHERFYAKLPLKAVYGGRTTECATSDISERGLSFVLDYPEYLPHDEEFGVSVEYDMYKSDMKCSVVHVSRRGNKWKYCLEIRDIDERNRREYFQIVYDRRHTMASELHSAWGLLDDFSLNLNARMKPIEVSMRKLPRIPVNRSYVTENGARCMLIDFNYRYANVIFEYYWQALADTFSLPLAEGVALRLKREKETFRPNEGRGLCSVVNWKELTGSAAFTGVIASWLKNDESEKKKEAVAVEA